MIEALDLIEQLEAQMTLFQDSSEVVAINSHALHGPMRVESRLFGLLQMAGRLFHATEGAFDITSGPLSQIWGFRSRSGKLPTDQEIAAARRLVGFDCVKLNPEEQTIELRRADAEINLHAIGKGYALDRAAQLLEQQQLTDFLWHGGRSSVLARGDNRAGRSSRTDLPSGHRAGNSDSAHGGWTVGLRHPLDPARRLAELHLHDAALATSGSATQYFAKDGKYYGHLIDPRTGWPATGICTATVIASTAAEADALATAFYIMGVEKTHDFCMHHPEIKVLLISAEEEGRKLRLHACGMQAMDWNRFD
jgi:FAD:protein FMN transferase